MMVLSAMDLLVAFTRLHLLWNLVSGAMRMVKMMARRRRRTTTTTMVMMDYDEHEEEEEEEDAGDDDDDEHDDDLASWCRRVGSWRSASSWCRCSCRPTTSRTTAGTTSTSTGPALHNLPILSISSIIMVLIVIVAGQG
jgi:hypothetical protein